MRDQRASRTAIDVGRAVLFLSEQPRYARLLPERAAELTARMLGALRRVLRWEQSWMRQRWFQWMVRVRERLLMPGAFLHIGLRKRFFDDQVQQAIGDGVQQVVVLGAGFDTLAMRVASRQPALYCFEIDHPATQQAKLRVLPEEFQRQANLRFIPADLSQTALGEALEADDLFDRSRPTVFLAEGLLMYLGEEEVRTLFQQIRSVAGEGSRLLFSFMTSDEQGRPRIGRSGAWIRLMLKLLGEPFRWSIRLEALDAFLGGSELALLRTGIDAQLLPELLPEVDPGTPTVDWEFYACAGLA